MKIAAILESNVTSGGGFNQALNAVVQMARICKSKYEFVVFTSCHENIVFLERLGCNAVELKGGFIDKWLIFSAANPWLRRLQSKLKLCGNWEKGLLAADVDLVYFVSPGTTCLALQRLNYIATVWDLCHRDTPEFPEVREFNKFLSREHMYTNTLAQSLFIVCDSKTLTNKISLRYGVDDGRLLAMPFSPAPFAEEEYSIDKIIVLTKYDLKEGYYFYPAQFWAHKNHVRILQALVALKSKGIQRQVIFCGGDYGNLTHVIATVKKLGLEKDVKFLGFVPAEDMRGLYEGCAAVVMPSYFGPTNLPPLEAWKLGRPLIYSSHLAKQVGNAALLVNPDLVEELVEAMLRVLCQSVANDLIGQGFIRLTEIEGVVEESEKNMINRLEAFSKRLECWK